MRGLTPDILTTPEELAVLFHHASNVTYPYCIVELGVFRGGSLAVLSDAAEWNVPVYGIDLFGRGSNFPDFYQEGSRWTRWWEKLSGRKFSWAEHEAAARAAARDAEIIVDDTVWEGLWWRDETIMRPLVGLLYIDADHSPEGVRADWEAWQPNLAPGAVVIFDDYGRSKYPGITELVDNLGYPVEVVGKIAIIRT